MGGLFNHKRNAVTKKRIILSFRAEIIESGIKDFIMCLKEFAHYRIA